MAKKSRAAGGTPATVALTAAGIAFEGRSYEHDPRAPSYGLEAAEACYRSAEYQAALDHARRAAERDLVIVEEAPPPAQ